jgi:hypothetical protein
MTTASLEASIVDISAMMWTTLAEDGPVKMANKRSAVRRKDTIVCMSESAR